MMIDDICKNNETIYLTKCIKCAKRIDNYI